MSDEPKPTEAAPVMVPRLLLVAVGLFLGAGAGHFAIGRQRRGIAIAAGYVVFRLASYVAFAFAPSVWTFLGLGLCHALHLASLVDLVRIPKSELRQGKLIQVAAAIALALIARRGVDHFVIDRHLVQSYVSSTAWMAPTLRDGDYLLLSLQKGTPRIGAIVVIRDAGQPEMQGVGERVAGVAGDKIEARDGELWRNDARVPVCALGKVGESELAVELLGEPHLIWRDANAKLSGSWTVGTGEILLLGDDRRSAAADTHGAVAKVSDVVGQGTFFVMRNGGFTLQEWRRMSLPAEAESMRDKVQPCLDELGYKP